MGNCWRLCVVGLVMIITGFVVGGDAGIVIGSLGAGFFVGASFGARGDGVEIIDFVILLAAGGWFTIAITLGFLAAVGAVFGGALTWIMPWAHVHRRTSR